MAKNSVGLDFWHGDLTTRVKINFWGNDGGTTGFGAIPFVKFPANSAELVNSSIEGGVIFPLAISLTEKWDIGIETAWAFARNDAMPRYDSEFIHSITTGYQFTDRLRGYIEFFSSVSTDTQSNWVGTFDWGVTYQLTSNIQLDCGVNYGVTRSAPEWNPFTGISVRF